MQMLFEKGEVSAQDRDHADATVKMSQANLTALEQSAKAEAAALDVAQANRKQVDARKSEISTTLAQLEQARATEAQVATQLGYTKIYAPIDGIVSVRVAKQGEVVAQGRPSWCWWMWTICGCARTWRKPTSTPIVRAEAARAAAFGRHH